MNSVIKVVEPFFSQGDLVFHIGVPRHLVRRFPTEVNALQMELKVLIIKFQNDLNSKLERKGGKTANPFGGILKGMSKAEKFELLVKKEKGEEYER